MEKEAIIRYKFYLCRNFLDKLLREKSHNRGAAQKDRKGCYKVDHGGLNPCPLLLVLIQKAADISVALVIDKTEFFRYDVL